MSVYRVNNNHKVVSWDCFIGYVRERHMKGKRVTTKYNFDMTRCKYATECKRVKKPSNGIIYYMQRDFRVYDNWALIYAQILALRTNTFVYIVIPIKQEMMFPTSRQFNFLIEGTKKF